MAASKWIVFDAFKRDLAGGVHDLDTDTLKVMLVTSTEALGNGTDSVKADIANELATGSGYTAGGVTVAGSITMSSATTTIDTADASWTASGGSITAHYAVLYNDTPTAPADPLIAFCYLDYNAGTPQDVTVTDGNTLTVTVANVFTLSGATSAT